MEQRLRPQKKTRDPGLRVYLVRYYGNLVAVNEYRGAEDDHELLLLERFLEHISMVPNVRAVEKRRWRSEVNGVSAGGRP